MDTKITLVSLESDRYNFHACWLQALLPSADPHQWLRFHCQCAECRQPFSNQRILDPSKIPGNITLLHAFIEGTYSQYERNLLLLLLSYEHQLFRFLGDCVVLEWTDNHKGRISLEWLVENHLHKLEKEDKSDLSLKKVTFLALNVSCDNFDVRACLDLADTRCLQSHSIGISVVNYKELEKSENVRHLYEVILKEGQVKVHGLPTTLGTVKKFVEDIFKLPVQRTIYGEVNAS